MLQSPKWQQIEFNLDTPPGVIHAFGRFIMDGFCVRDYVGGYQEIAPGFGALGLRLDTNKGELTFYEDVSRAGSAA